MMVSVQVFTWAYVFIHLGIHLGVELLGHMVNLCLSFLRNGQKMFLNHCTMLCFPPQKFTVPILSPLHQHLLLHVIPTTPIPLTVKWCGVIWKCISLTTQDVELLMCVLAIYLSSLVKCHVKLQALLYIRKTVQNKVNARSSQSSRSSSRETGNVSTSSLYLMELCDVKQCNGYGAPKTGGCHTSNKMYTEILNDE